MKYYYGTLIIETIFFVLILIKIISLIINLKNKKIQKRWWSIIIILIPLMLFCLNSFLITPYMDFKYAIKGETKITQGIVEKVYVSGGTNSFILDGKEFRRNPWSFKPKEGEKYTLTYLPNSRYVVDYELLSD